MTLLDTDIKEFQRLYKKQFGIELKKDEARKQLAELVHLMELVYQPVSHDQLKRLVEKNIQKGGEKDYNS